MANVTIKDVAERAKVSTATVDRVLHNRSGVSSIARKRVKEAIHDLGFGQLPGSLVRHARGRLKFLFLLPVLDTGFVRQIIEAIRRAQSAVTDVEIRVEIIRIDLQNGNELIEALANAPAGTYDGIGLFAIDAPGVRAAIDDAADRGIPVVTLVSDVPSSARASFAGIDNVAAGRTAGRLMGRFLGCESGEIGVIAGNMNIRDHVERHMGFRQVLGANYRNLTTLFPLEGDSVAARNKTLVLDLIRKHERLVGLYAIGGGNTGIIAALQGLASSRRPVTIVHEATPDTKRALNSELIDAVVGQDAGHIARSAVRQLTALALGDVTNPEQEHIRIDIFLAENLT